MPALMLGLSGLRVTLTGASLPVLCAFGPRAVLWAASLRQGMWDPVVSPVCDCFSDGHCVPSSIAMGRLVGLV